MLAMKGKNTFIILAFVCGVGYFYFFTANTSESRPNNIYDENTNTQVCFEARSNESISSANIARGAIVVLAKGGKSEKDYKYLVLRNKSVRRHLWVKNFSDIIIFHEGNINENHQRYIQSQTDDMPIHFVNVSDIFSLFKKVNKSECPTSGDNFRDFTPGYHSMCYFWFIGFRQYVKEYSWLLRFDADCYAKSNFCEKLPLPNHYHFGVAEWRPLHSAPADRIAENKPDGKYVRGMKALVNRIANKHGLNKTFHTWTTPYNNVYYLNLNWLRNHVIVNDFMREVDASDCIYSSRWGDSPLWGAALTLAGERLEGNSLPIKYYHASHRTLVP